MLGQRFMWVSQARCDCVLNSCYGPHYGTEVSLTMLSLHAAELPKNLLCSNSYSPFQRFCWGWSPPSNHGAAAMHAWQYRLLQLQRYVLVPCTHTRLGVLELEK